MSTVALRRTLEVADAPSLPVPETRAGSGTSITVRGLSKAFGEKTVLSGLDLHIPAGQFVAIVGKSGCGKSTLLRLLVGLDRPTTGEVRVGDPAVARPTSRLMFQEPRLLPWQRVLGNVEVGLSPDTPRRQRREQAQAALAEVGLGDRGGEWPSILSGGQKQRVALARALVSRPKLLALDEPLGALDALTRIEMQGLVERVWGQQGFTSLLVTHDVSEAVALADRIVVLDEGRVALDLPVEVPRPRRKGDPALAALEGRILDRLFNDHGAGI